jgi:hypothetical protein
VVLLAFLGFAAGGWLGARQVPADAGLAAGATVFLWAAGGAVAALFAGIVLALRLTPRARRAIVLVTAVLSLLALLWVGVRIANPPAHVLYDPSVAHAAPAPVPSRSPVASAERPEPRTDYLTLAHGAIPVHVGGGGASLGASFEKAIRAVDGDPAPFVLTLKPGSADTEVEFVYELPALTTFDRFAVPNVLETPSPGATFSRGVEIQGSATGATQDFVVLASATLATHKARGHVTEIAPRTRKPVRWIRIRLEGGIQVTQPATFFEFSEIVGNGTQEPVPRSERFNGVWKGRGVAIRLAQDGPVVTGCYDRDGELSGTVTGNLLHAIGTARSTGVESAFILNVRGDGTLFGVRSANRAPFALCAGETAASDAAPPCPSPPNPLGCGAVIHGITFDFDSDVIRADSEPVLARLFEGLKGDPAAAIVIEGHTSSEGTDAYNAALSERRAQAVRADLVRRGIAASRLTAVGAGEAKPIARNDDESGRSLNRRVEVHCR